MSRGSRAGISRASSTFCQRRADSTMPTSVRPAAAPSQASVPSDGSGTSSPRSNDGARASSTASMRALTPRRTPRDIACLPSTSSSSPGAIPPPAGVAARPVPDSTAARRRVPRGPRASPAGRATRWPRRDRRARWAPPPAPPAAHPLRPTPDAEVPVGRSRTRTLGLCTAVAAVAIIGAMTDRAGDEPADDRTEAPDAAADAVGAPGPHTLGAAVDATRAVDRARVELRTTVAGPDGPVDLVHRAHFTDGGMRAHAETDMSEVAAALEGAGQQLGGDFSRPTAIVVDGDTVYSQIGPMAESLGRSPDDWVSARLSDIVAVADAADNDTLSLVLDPLGPLDLLRHPVAEIDHVGDEEVRGTPTRHLRAELDITGGGAPPPGTLEGRLAAVGLHRLPVDVWLDEA